MSLYCADGEWADLPPPATGKRTSEDDRCRRVGCGKLAWQHWTVRPMLTTSTK